MPNLQPLPSSHPITDILESVASGQALTSGQLKTLSSYDDALPEGQSLTSLQSAVRRGANEIEQSGSHPMCRRQQAALVSSELAAQMTDQQRQLHARTPDGEDYTSITQRMFKN